MVVHVAKKPRNQSQGEPFPHPLCRPHGCQLSDQCLSARPHHLPNSVTYLRRVSNRANGARGLDLCAVEQIQSATVSSSSSPLQPSSLMFVDDWIDCSTHSLSNRLPGTVLLLCHLSSAADNWVTVSKSELVFAEMPFRAGRLLCFVFFLFYRGRWGGVFSQHLLPLNEWPLNPVFGILDMDCTCIWKKKNASINNLCQTREHQLS